MRKRPKDYVTGVEVYLLRFAYLNQGSDSSDPEKVEQYEATIGRFNFVLRGPFFTFEDIEYSVVNKGVSSPVLKDELPTTIPRSLIALPNPFWMPPRVSQIDHVTCCPKTDR